MAAASGDAHPWPIYNARYRVVFPVFDADGDLVSAMTTPDSEVSQDQGTFADATNEATEIATGSGMYYLDLIAGEMDTKCTAVIVKSATAGMKTTPLIMYPRRFPVLRTGTAQAGAATTITLDSGASAVDDFYNGCYVNITNNSPANAQGQARRIVDYVGSTKVATVEAAWGTNPSSASTFEILLTDDVGADMKMLAGSAVNDPVNSGIPNVRLADAVSHGGTLGSSTATLALSRASIVSQSSNTPALILTGLGSGAGALLTGGTSAGVGLDLVGTGNGSGLRATGGSTGSGVTFAGGTTGHGVNITASGGSRNGINIAAAGLNGHGIEIANVDGHGILVTAASVPTAARYGINVNGAGSVGGDIGDGIRATGAQAGSGMRLSSLGTGNGLRVLGGTTGAGVNITATSGDGITVTGGGNGSGMTLTGAGNGEGLSATGGTNGSGAEFTAGGGNTNGIYSIGAGSGSGFRADGGATGNGISGIGGASSGAGMRLNTTDGAGLSIAGSGEGSHGIAITTTDGNGISIAAASAPTIARNGISATGSGAIGTDVGNGIVATGAQAGHGLRLSATGTGSGLRVSGGSTSGAGVNITATSGDGITVTGGTNGSGINATGAGTGDGMQLTGGGGGGVDLDADMTGNITGNLSGSVGSVTAAVTVGTINANVVNASALAADAVTEIWAGSTAPSAATIADAVWDEAQADHVAVGSFGITASEIADILVDTAEIGAAGAGLTNINLPDQTMNITGNITGNLSGSVGSVTAGVTLANAVTHGGATAVLQLQSVSVSNSAGNAVTLASTGANGHGLATSGNGSGSGLISTGGTTGIGIQGVGGSGSGNAMDLTATDGHGFRSQGTGAAKWGLAVSSTASDAARFTASSGGHGALFTAGATGSGIRAVGGATSGNGIAAVATGIGDGIVAVGAGGGYDINADIQGSLSGSVGSVTGLTAANLDVAVSTRLATAGYTAPDNASITAILADTNELQTDWVNGGRLDLILDARASQVSVDDLPTNAELATALDPLPTAAENATAVGSLTITELAAVPGASPALKDALALLYMAVRNLRETTATSDTIANDAGAAIATATLSDNGTTFSKSEYV